MTRISFIGGGNMARSIIGGLVAEGFAPGDLLVSGPRLATLAALGEQFGVALGTDNRQACAGADVLVLAVKPQVMRGVCEALAGAIDNKTLVISVAAGIPLASLERWLGGTIALVRAMPNTPAQLRLGATGLFANQAVSQAQRQLANQIMAAVGLVQWVDSEELIDTVTAVSGSGPAYFFLFMEAMIEAAMAQGLDADSARALTLQTALGAATLAQSSNQDVAQLRRQVTSPNGTTEQAILSFEASQLKATVAAAMGACRKRAQELATELGSG